MPSFERFLARHGDFLVQALIENIERNEGIRPASGSTLEDRWNVLMQGNVPSPPPLSA